MFELNFRPAWRVSWRSGADRILCRRVHSDLRRLQTCLPAENMIAVVNSLVDTSERECLSSPGPGSQPRYYRLPMGRFGVCEIDRVHPEISNATHGDGTTRRGRR